MRILVCGGRDFNNKELLFEYMDNVMYTNACWDSCIIIEGGQKGADLLAREWAFARTQACAQVDAHWDTLKKAAGPMRNSWMLRLKPDLVIAFPGGPGTANMIRKAEEAGIKVERVMY